ncbi:MAG: hypothetical protein AAFN11_23060 [Chloroflexota bacterium]
MKTAIKTFGYITLLIALAGGSLGAIYGVVVGSYALITTSGVGGLLMGAWFGAIFGGIFGANAGGLMGIIVGLAVAIAQAPYSQPYTANQARFIGRVGDVVALIICIGVTIIGSLSGEGSVFMFGIPAIIAFLACHKVVLSFLHMYTRESKQKVKSMS